MSHTISIEVLHFLILPFMHVRYGFLTNIQLYPGWKPRFLQGVYFGCRSACGGTFLLICWWYDVAMLEGDEQLRRWESYYHILSGYCQVQRLCSQRTDGLLDFWCCDVLVRWRVYVWVRVVVGDQSAYILLIRGCAKSLEKISPPIMYVVALTFSTFNAKIICGSWLDVAVISIQKGLMIE